MDKKHNKIRFFRILGAVFIAFMVYSCSHCEVSISGNEAGRFAVIQAVGEQGTFAIENTEFRTVDKVVRGNHVYCDKPPLLMWCWGQLWRVIHRFGGLSFNGDYYLSVKIINFLFGVFHALLLYHFFFQLISGEISWRRITPELKLLLAGALVCTGWIWSYSTMLNNHTAAAVWLTGMLLALRRFTRRAHWKSALLAGVSAGLTGICDLPVGAIAGIAAVTLIFLECRQKPKKQHYTLFAAAGGGAILLALLLCNLAAYGTMLPLYLVKEGTWGAPAVSWGALLVYGWHILSGCRGLFSYQPVLIFGLAGLINGRHNPLLRTALVLMMAITLFYWRFTDEYGGAAYGFRYLIVVIPLLFLGLPGTLKFRLPGKAKAAMLAAALLWGLVTGAVGAYAPFCLAFENHRSPAGHFTREIQSTFAGNLLTWSYERHPQGAVCQMLIRRYGRETAARYLYHALFHLKKAETLGKLVQELKSGNF